MVNKTIPFRPKLEGVFRTRFYTVANVITAQTTTEILEAIVFNELHWVENDFPYNIDQRRKYRATLLSGLTFESL